MKSSTNIIVCPICLDEMEEYSIICHTMHHECANQLRDVRCPICRKELEYDWLKSDDIKKRKIYDDAERRTSELNEFIRSMTNQDTSHLELTLLISRFIIAHNRLFKYIEQKTPYFNENDYLVSHFIGHVQHDEELTIIEKTVLILKTLRLNPRVPSLIEKFSDFIKDIRRIILCGNCISMYQEYEDVFNIFRDPSFMSSIFVEY